MSETSRAPARFFITVDPAVADRLAEYAKRDRRTVPDEAAVLLSDYVEQLDTPKRNDVPPFLQERYREQLTERPAGVASDQDRAAP